MMPARERVVEQTALSPIEARFSDCSLSTPCVCVGAGACGRVRVCVCVCVFARGCFAFVCWVGWVACVCACARARANCVRVDTPGNARRSGGGSHAFH